MTDLPTKDLKSLTTLRKTANVKKAEKELAECPKEDASENAQLQTARENLARANHVLFMLQKRLQAFEACVVGYTYRGVITLGSTVELNLLSVDNNPPNFEPHRFIAKVVNHDASDARNGFISCDSQCGLALLGKVAGDVINVTAPKGVLQYKIERMY